MGKGGMVNAEKELRERGRDCMAMGGREGS